jgi:carbamoylphosphate synthase large subunit
MSKMSKKMGKKGGKRNQVAVNNVDELLVVDINADLRCGGDTWISDR